MQKLQKMVKIKMTRTKLEKFCLSVFLPVYSLAKKKGGEGASHWPPPLDPPMNRINIIKQLTPKLKHIVNKYN